MRDSNEPDPARRQRRPLRRLMLCGAAALAALVASALAVPLQAATDDQYGASWPAGEGRELTGAWCGGCHSLNLVKQQGLTRDGWDELLHWMTAKQNMPPLEGDMRDRVLDYLAANFDTGRDPGATAIGDELPPLDPVQGIRRPALEIRP